VGIKLAYARVANEIRKQARMMRSHGVSKSYLAGHLMYWTSPDMLFSNISFCSAGVKAKPGTATKMSAMMNLASDPISILIPFVQLARGLARFNVTPKIHVAGELERTIRGFCF
jgi:hypothetical protein